MLHFIIKLIVGLIERNPDNKHDLYIDRFLLEYGCTLLSCTDTDRAFDFKDPRPANTGIFEQTTHFKQLRFRTSEGQEMECGMALLKDVSSVPPKLHLVASIDFDLIVPPRFLPYFIQQADLALSAKGYHFHQLDPTRKTFDYKNGQLLNVVPATDDEPRAYFKVARCMSPAGELKDLLLAFVSGAASGPEGHPAFSVYAAQPL